MRFRIMSLAAVLVVAPALASGQQPQAREILQRAEAAVRTVRCISYDARAEADGILATQVPKMSGTVTLTRGSDGGTARILIDAQVVLPLQAGVFRVQVACDGKVVTLVDHARGLFAQTELPAGLTLLNSVGPLHVRELVGARPFEAELRAVRLTYHGVERVDDLECDVVHAVLAAEAGEVRWHFARSDHLPRRVQRFMETPLGRASVTTTLTRLDPQASVRDPMFRLEKPEGFSEVTVPPTGGAAPGLLPVGSDAPPWTLKTPQGQAVSLKDLRGRLVLLDFWATWCGPCRIAMPGVQRLYEKYKGKPVAIFGVNCWERSPQARPAEFMKSKGFTYPLLLNADEVAVKYRVTGIPTLYLIDPDGKVLLAYAGASEDGVRQAEQLIDQWLAKLVSRATTQTSE